MLRRWTALYGANPLHLLALLASFALAGYAALQARTGPLPARMLAWFIGAVVVHDLALYPLYALADRSLAALVHRRRSADDLRPRGTVNYVRVPAVLSGLLLLMFWPLVTGHSEPAYRSASGLGTSVYLGRWLVLSGVAFACSALLYAVRAGRALRR